MGLVNMGLYKNLYKRKMFCSLAALSLLLLLRPLQAQQVTDSGSDIKIKKVRGVLALHSTIAIKVENLSAYLRRNHKVPEKFVLYLDGRKMIGIGGRLSANLDVLEFDINRNEDSKEQWNALLGKPLSKDKKGFKKGVKVSIGYEDELPLPGVPYNLQIINRTGFYIFIVFFLVALVFLYWVSKNTGLLRDPAGGIHVKYRTYSLSRVQMTFWTFLITVSYVFIFLITYEINSIPDSIFVLMGISSATMIGGSVVDKSKESEAANKNQSQAEQQKALVSDVNNISEQLTKEPQNADLKKQLESKVTALKESEFALRSGSILEDLLYDKNGLSIHRLQMVIWTLLFGVVFIVSIYNSLTMPDFNGNLLALMGISSGTYVGLKLPE